MNNKLLTKEATILTSFTVGLSSMASLISSAGMVVTAFSLYKSTMKRPDKIALMLSIYIYALICLLMINLLSMNIQTILGDSFGLNFNSRWCPIQGYLLSPLTHGLYHIFTLQVNFLMFEAV